MKTRIDLYRITYEAPYLKSYQDEEDEEDEEADCLEYIDNTDKIIYLYYQDDKCVGKVKLRKIGTGTLI